ncbi:BolA family transcriptional regulator [Brevundimonas naejangsanensis]|uniref:BolA family transcriptional regulator n=1 Tax=Brevundimonas naejangsanensis TaxID=588932 RepID=A0A494RI02_9CAUL|nr:BolA family protein [Brevundimonas naejangsanensis]AYG96001.1 BolA family transcriptional regulator [Brevundimonas naejangsanensis]
MSEGPIATIIRQKLTAAFAPRRLELEDDSWKHAGHHHEGGIDARDGGESHFRLTIVSDAFAGQNRVARQRAVKVVLKDELAGPVHALSIRAQTPEEADS